MRYLKPILTSLTAVFCVHFAIQAQIEGPFDNFKQRKDVAIAELKKYPNPDTSRVNALINVFTSGTFLKEREEVAPYRVEAFAISRRLNFTRGLAFCYSSTANQYKSGSRYPEALQYFDSALYIIGSSTDPRLLALKGGIHQQMGAMYNTDGNYYAGLDHFFEALKYTDYISNITKIRINLYITDIYITLENYDKAMEFAKRNEDLIKTTDRLMRTSVYFPFIDISLAKHDFKTAILYLDKIAPSIPDPVQVQENFGYYMKKGHVNYLQERYDNAFPYYQQAFKYAQEGGHKNSRSEALRYLSNTALKLGDNESAKRYAMENLSLTGEINEGAKRVEALISLSNYYDVEGDKPKSLALMREAMKLKDSIIAETNIKQINILGAIYEAEKQSKEISRLQTEKERQDVDARHKSFLIKLFIASIIILLILGYLAYNNFKNRQQLAKNQQAIQRQKITELEKDKQLLTIDAMLKGQEEERSRIAKDLHDGLGSLLSGTKLSFMNIKENLVLSPDNAVLFDRSLSMLDNTIGDLRKVAQNLMPEALVKFGLNDALQDFCDTIQSTTGLKVFYQQIGEMRKMNNTATVFIYRIVQELVNNAVRHAEASQIIVQLAMTEGRTVITVEDNGKGFDKNILSRTRGAGMANISYRMQYFNGTSDIVTAPGKGTSVTIELIV